MARLTYFVRETFISLRRNVMMTIAGIMTVAISLVLFGGILLVSATVDHGTERWKHGVDLEIFMKVTASDQQVKAIGDELRSDPMVKSITFLDHNAAMNEFKKDFANQPALIESTTPENLPESYRVVPVKAEKTEQIRIAYKDQLGVDTVITAEQQVKRLLTVIRAIRIFFVILATVLLASSLFLIVNTIRLATFARRREIEVMKLVGASNWFVRVPFMAEGFVQGVIGAGIAFGAVWFLRVVIGNFVSHPNSIVNSFRVTDTDAIGIGILVLFIGAMIGTVGSAIGLRRFLEV
ncbi:MAG TPA: permease-like cell division protein FtsX [Acidimicrobiia bacterium]|nr:permease-like cell division protein FtsX [Acidimicrobiia bacterium]